MDSIVPFGPQYHRFFEVEVYANEGRKEKIIWQDPELENIGVKWMHHISKE